jgi:LAO/AO transport system kinase
MFSTTLKSEHDVTMCEELKIEELTQGVVAGNPRCIARAITLLENNSSEAQELIHRLYARTGKAHVIGITGSSGAGKSTLIEKIVREYRRRGKTVGVVAVDPTSPFTGGAFLGDRIRMQELSTDPGVFIRSMASRNYAGGLAHATKDAVKVLDAAGRDIILVETVGAGQSEVEIIKVAQTIVVVHAPGLGDEIQAIKAGIMEIADIFVVNKADRENASKTVMDIQAILQMDNKEKTWKPSIVKTVALTGEGVSDLVDQFEEHRCFYEGNESCRKNMLKDKAEAELVEAVKDQLVVSVIDDVKRSGKFDELVESILKKEIDPRSAADKLLKKPS